MLYYLAVRAVLEVFTVPPFDENTYLVGDADAGLAAVVDPGGRAADIVREAERRGTRIHLILATHGHIDHVSGVDELRALTGAPFWAHADGAPLLAALPRQAAMFGLPAPDPPRVDGHLSAGQALHVGALTLEVRHTPGHAPGHVTLVGPEIEWDGTRQRFALVGDVIFYGSIGRTDLPGGDYDTLLGSITREILSLPEDTVLHSGHGPATTVGRERRFNPFVREWLREHGR